MKTGPAFPRTRYDGQGGYASNSHNIPISGWIGGAVVVAVLLGLFWLGSPIF